MEYNQVLIYTQCLTTKKLVVKQLKVFLTLNISHRKIFVEYKMKMHIPWPS